MRRVIHDNLFNKLGILCKSQIINLNRVITVAEASRVGSIKAKSPLKIKIFPIGRLRPVVSVYRYTNCSLVPIASNEESCI